MIDIAEKRMYLSIKRLMDDPWLKIKEKYPLKSHHTGVIKYLNPVGIFVELEFGIGGMILLSDISWAKKYNHPSEFVQIGQNIEVMILKINLLDRKMTLKYKSLEVGANDSSFS